LKNNKKAKNILGLIVNLSCLSKYGMIIKKEISLSDIFFLRQNEK
jgi:hypothetical protein